MDLKAMERAMGAYTSNASAADAARLEFFAGLYRLQDEWANRAAAMCGYPVPTAEQVRDWYWTGESVFSRIPVPFDADTFAKTLYAMTAYLSDHAGLDETAAEGLRVLDWNALCQRMDLELAGRDPAAFVESCVAGVDELGVDSDVPVTLFAMVVAFGLRAWLQRPSEAVMDAAPRDHHENHDAPLDCPVCGSPATASFVGESAGTDGRGRRQYCATCGAQWHFERIRCGVCGTQNQSHLHYFNLEGDNAHRIQSCDECGLYQRVVFQDDIPGALCMEVEDVVMAKLDRVALDPRFRKEAEN